MGVVECSRWGGVTIRKHFYVGISDLRKREPKSSRLQLFDFFLIVNIQYFTWFYSHSFAFLSLRAPPPPCKSFRPFKMWICPGKWCESILRGGRSGTQGSRWIWALGYRASPGTHHVTWSKLLTFSALHLPLCTLWACCGDYKSWHMWSLRMACLEVSRCQQPPVQWLLLLVYETHTDGAEYPSLPLEHWPSEGKSARITSDLH